MDLNGEFENTANPQLKISATEMYKKLLRRVMLDKFSKEDLPKVSTITNWIMNTSQSFKKTMALHLLKEAESSKT
ncbi:2_t:CDS:2 [Ambispora leptoticha]|uniref:2_t:CDS:1 n=1 Tax=Ambispora leptoticha TaxID=144679 RepID=A0A9N9C1H8_9GLOM|nr:2_t:CDS:2 [Ambispora leptoticha]